MQSFNSLPKTKQSTKDLSNNLIFDVEDLIQKGDMTPFELMKEKKKSLKINNQRIYAIRKSKKVRNFYIKR